MRLLVCGPRDWTDAACVWRVLDLHLRNCPEGEHVEIISGGARGVDTMAVEWAEARNVAYTVVPANWHIHGKAAGPIRNERMAELQPHKIIAFAYGRRRALTVGTRDMVERAKKHAIPVDVIEGG